MQKKLIEKGICYDSVINYGDDIYSKLDKIIAFKDRAATDKLQVVFDDENVIHSDDVIKCGKEI